MRVGDGGIVLLPGEGRSIDVGPFGVTVYAEGDGASGLFSLIETTEPEPGVGPPMHIHHDCSESFFVLAGAYEMFVDDLAFECPVGSFIYVPSGMRHTFRNTVPGSRKLNLYTPSAMVRYFDELAAGIHAGAADADLDAISARYSMEVVGPVPAGYLTSPGRSRRE